MPARAAWMFALTDWLQVAERLPQLSIACQVRVTEKPVRQLPFVIVPTMTMVTFVPSAPSVAVGRSKVQAPSQVTSLSAGQIKTGGVVSSTRTNWLQLAERFEQPSAACHVRVTV